MNVRFILTYTNDEKIEVSRFYVDRDTSVIPLVGWKIELKGIRAIVESVLIDYDNGLVVVELERIIFENMEYTWEEMINNLKEEWHEL